ncbi:hypothetical protein [Bradyrhizobium sp.]
MSLDQGSIPPGTTPPESGPKRSGTKKPPDIEAILREEIRALRELWMRILQWGVTVMIAAGSIIFYARRAIKEDFTVAGKLKLGEPLPLTHHLIGTVFLILLAYVFSVLSGLASRRYRSYFDQLIRKSTSGVDDIIASGHSRWIIPWIFWLFPLFDILLRVYYFELGFGP